MLKREILRDVDDGVDVSVRAQPRAAKSEVAGAYGERAIKIRLAAPPVDGAANDELVKLFAELFDLPERRVELTRGHGSRDKTIHLHGISLETARRRLGL